MEAGQPSRTAFGAAAHRAAHQVLESGRIFADPLAVRILGQDADEVARQAHTEPSRRPMRLFIAVRTRFAEDALAAAVATGTRQLVVLGAGLDTFAYRNPYPHLRVFEVDHPATQAWKRARLADAALPVPPSLTFTPIDFERETLADGLAASGFDPAADTFFSWLGVVPYLSREAIVGTLRYLAGLTGAVQVVFDYGEPLSHLPPERRAAYEAQADRVASIGEPWITRFDPEELARELRELGFDEIDDLGIREIAERYFQVPVDPARRGAGHVIRAGRPALTA